MSSRRDDVRPTYEAQPHTETVAFKSHDSDMMLVRNWTGQNTGGALAVAKGLVGKFPNTLYIKKSLRVCSPRYTVL